VITSERPSGPIASKTPSKINHTHLGRLAIVYVRQSTQHQVLQNRESRQRQYALAEYARQLGWPEDRVLVIDEDQGISGKSAENRPGFQRLLSEVSLKHVGLVLGLELSRLSRSSSDWHHLIDVCGVFGTLLCDEDRIYDPLDSNDRLLLGMKGAMNEFELVTIRNRLLRGSLNKAQRGELYLSVPAGYIKLTNGEVALDPDEQARASVTLVFDKFTSIRSVYGVFSYMQQNNLKMGFRIHKGARKGELEWRLPTPARVSNILHHPIYAGAYAYGMRRYNKMHRNSDGVESKSWFLKPDDIGILIKDKVPAYISWEQFESNLKQIAENRSSYENKGTPRRGQALLAGLVECGRCQRKMTTSYKTDKLPTYACNEFFRNQEMAGHCGRMATKSLDELVSQQVLKAIEPAALELSIASIADIDSERKRLHLEWDRRLQRARYECEKAERQYRSVEPEHRLVARTLETAWETSLAEMQKTQEEYRRFDQMTPKQLSQEDIQAIRDLSSSIPSLWLSATTTNEDRKRIIRAMIDKITVVPSLENENVDVTIQWHGGFHSQHLIYKAVGSYRQLQEYDRLCERIRELHTKGWHHQAIAEQLNKDGFVPPRRRGVFTYQNVGELIRNIGLQGELFQDVLRANEWWIPDLSTKLGVIQQRVHYWAKQGWVHYRKTPSNKHWIVWADKEELRRLRKLCKTRGSYTAKNHPELVTPKPRPSR
jgi:DNA invertase Pin-like site-specific DNA recombinase